MNKEFKLICGDNIEVLKTYPDDHFDSIVTDPPYGIDFQGREWDKNTGAVETWEQCLRVLKPGGHLLAFSAARTCHRLASNIEDCGFEIRDQIMWIYGSGFPKSQDIGKAIQKRIGVEESEEYQFKMPRIAGADAVDDTQYNNAVCTSPEAKEWAGWAQALKPAHEPIVMARKPFKGACVDNILKHRTGALNIDSGRIPFEDDRDKKSAQFGKVKGDAFYNPGSHDQLDWSSREIQYPNGKGRYPSNVIGDLGEHQRFFFCPKIMRSERHIGFDEIPKRITPDTGTDNMRKIGDRYHNPTIHGNNHPTVKPVALMSYLVKLVTPPGGRILDPFNGSGSTGMAAHELGFEYTGIDLDQSYIDISQTRIVAWASRNDPDNEFKSLFE